MLINNNDYCVGYGFTIDGWGTSYKSREAYRDIGEIIVTDTLPTYVDKDGNTQVAEVCDTTDAKWERIEDGAGTVTQLKRSFVIDPTVPNVINALGQIDPLSPGAPIWQLARDSMIYVRFKDPKVEPCTSFDSWAGLCAQLTNKADFELIPYQAAAGESPIQSSDDVRFQLTGIDQGGAIPGLAKTPSTNDGMFYDDTSSKAQSFIWDIYVANSTNLHFTNIEFNDLGLDPRMKLTQIALLGTWLKANVDRFEFFETAAPDDSPEQTIAIGDFTWSAEFDLDWGSRERSDVKVLDGTKIFRSMRVITKPGSGINPGDVFDIGLLSKLINPDTVHFNSIDINQNIFNNYVSVTGKIFNGISGYDRSFVSDRANYYRLVIQEEKVEIEKNLKSVGNEEIGSTINIDFDIRPHLTGNRDVGTVQLVDFLPEGLEPFRTVGGVDHLLLDGEAIPIDPGNTMATTWIESAVYRTNYRESGRNAMIFTGKPNFLGGRRVFVDLVQVKITDRATMPTLTNDVYLVFDSGPQAGLNAVDVCGSPSSPTCKPDVYDLDSDGNKTENLAWDQSEIVIPLPATATVYKRIQYGGVNSSAGYTMKLNDEYEYLLHIINTSPTDWKGVVLYDVLPNNGYGDGDSGDVTYFDPAVSRGSEFIDLLRGPINVSEQFEVFYRTISPPFYNLAGGQAPLPNTDWLTQAALPVVDGQPDWSAVKAFKIELKAGEKIQYGDSLDIVIPMKAPSAFSAKSLALLANTVTHPLTELDSKTGFKQTLVANNALAFRGEGLNWKVSDTVYNNLSLYGFYAIKVDSETKAPIAGVKLDLMKKVGGVDQLVMTATTNVSGMAMFNGLMKGNYTLKETTTPTGYLVNNAGWVVDVAESTADVIVIPGKVGGTGIESDPFQLGNIKIKLNEIVATKTWVGGKAADHTEVTIHLYQKVGTAGEELVLIPAAVTSTASSFTHRWENMPATSADGTPITYRVEEDGVSPDGTKLVNGRTYQVTQVDNSITNTYVPPMDGTFSAKKIWVNGPVEDHTSSSVTMELYRKIDGGENEKVIGYTPVVGGIGEGPFTYDWSKLPKTDNTANDYIYSVKETGVGLDNSVLVNGRTYDVKQIGNDITNTYRVPLTAAVTAAKTWVNGPTGDHTAIELKLYRQVEGGVKEEAVGKTPTVTGAAEGPFTYTWSTLEKTDTAGKEYTYSVEEDVNADHNLTHNWRTYHMTRDGDHFTNTYVSAKQDVMATKVWVGGKKEWQTEVALTLTRTSANVTTPEIVSADPVVSSAGDPDLTYTYTWAALDVTDSQGANYTYSVIEPVVPANYRAVVSGMTVANTYTIPKISISVGKTWVGGTAQLPDSVMVTLSRTIGSEAPAIVETGTLNAANSWKVSWTVDKTDASGNEYVYSVSESGTANFIGVVGGSVADGFTITNTYAIPTDGVARGTKVWVNGPAVKPTVWFKLYRNIEGGAAAEVPGAEVKEMSNGVTEALWVGLEKTDNMGHPYVFTIKETDASGADFVPADYTKAEEGLTVTNTYVPPTTGTAEGMKVWMNGPAVKPTVWFKLYRAVEGGMADEVPGAEVKELANGVTTVSWSGLEKTDNTGHPYVFTIKETDASGADFVPADYTKAETGLTVTNTYQPVIADVTATLEWIGGSDPRSTVWFQLYRSDDGTTNQKMLEKVDTPRELPDGILEMVWTDLPVTDLNGNTYTYFVNEVDASGDDLVPEEYRKEEKLLHVRNIWIGIDVTAHKVWAGNGPDPKPTVWFQLWRQTGDEDAEVVPGAELKKLVHGVTEVIWMGVEKRHAGKEYDFFVREVSSMGYDFELANYVKQEKGLTVTNAYFFFPDGEDLLLPNTGFTAP